MKLRKHLLLPFVFTIAAALSVVTATISVRAIEARSEQAVRRALSLEGQSWVNVRADGMLLHLTGMAETEALRFRALSVAGTVVDASHVIDEMEVRPAEEIRAPDFSVEILRNDDGISLIGLIPASEDREAVVNQISELSGGDVSDMLETANYPTPNGWDDALAFGLDALRSLPRSKISIMPNSVTVTAITESANEKTRLERNLTRRAPDGMELALNLSAPRPVITPFTLRFLINEEGARFDACSADTPAARDRILAAAKSAGAAENSLCTIGLGVPSPRWSSAVVSGIEALAALGEGSVTFSDADISLIAADSVSQENFDRVIGELEGTLPDVFSLTSVLTEKPDETTGGPPQFTARLDEDGRLEMRGRLTDAAVRNVVESFAIAQFGTGQVYDATRVDEKLPNGWPVRVLAALEALAHLAKGAIIVEPDFVQVSGTTGNPEANAEIARILAEKLREGAKFEISVQYEERLDPVLGLPTPEDCITDLNAILAVSKITFAPGSADIGGESLATLDALADAMKECSEVRMEIGAHSDSQGREEMNLSLSQARADSVLNGLLARRVLTSNLTAVGYGESQPIADNDTEEGREANRRIEFTLILPESDTDSSEDAAGDEAPANTDEVEPQEEEEAPAPEVAPPAEDAQTTDEEPTSEATNTETADTEEVETEGTPSETSVRPRPRQTNSQETPTDAPETTEPQQDETDSGSDTEADAASVPPVEEAETDNEQN